MMLDRARDWFGFFPAQSDKIKGHAHAHDGSHGHAHGVIDPTIATTERGIWAIKWSFLILAITAVLQILVVLVSGSVALLADTIHNFADATTAIPLWIAFLLARRRPTDTFTYGYGRVEDLAGIAIVLIILFSALVAGYEAIDRIVHPQPITLLMWVAIAGFIGFIGNESVAVFRIRVGREINSAALIADGYHARTDGLTSLAVVLGATGVWLGFPLADPIVGLFITIAILGIVWQSATAVLTRMLDGVDPSIASDVRHAAEHVAGLNQVLDVKTRWLGHKLHADVAVLVDGTLSVAEADRLGGRLKQELFAHIPTLSVANVRVHGSDPAVGNITAAIAATSGSISAGTFRGASARVLKIKTSKNAALVRELSCTGSVGFKKINGFDAQGLGTTTSTICPSASRQLHLPSKPALAHYCADGAVAISAFRHDNAARVRRWPLTRD